MTPPRQSVTPNQPGNKSKTTIWLWLWLGALPATFVLSFINRIVLNTQTANETVSTSVNQSQDPVSTIINFIGLLLGLYFLVGWIPFLIALSRSKKKS